MQKPPQCDSQSSVRESSHTYAQPAERCHSACGAQLGHSAVFGDGEEPYPASASAHLWWSADADVFTEGWIDRDGTAETWRGQPPMLPARSCPLPREGYVVTDPPPPRTHRQTHIYRTSSRVGIIRAHRARQRHPTTSSHPWRLAVPLATQGRPPPPPPPPPPLLSSLYRPPRQVSQTAELSLSCRVASSSHPPPIPTPGRLGGEGTVGRLEGLISGGHKLCPL